MFVDGLATLGDGHLQLPWWRGWNFIYKRKWCETIFWSLGILPLSSKYCNDILTTSNILHVNKIRIFLPTMFGMIYVDPLEIFCMYTRSGCFSLLSGKNLELSQEHYELVWVENKWVAEGLMSCHMSCLHFQSAVTSCKISVICMIISGHQGCIQNRKSAKKLWRNHVLCCS